jgi:hypothetical protein
MARTRALIREVNERMAEIAAEMSFDDPIVLFCECARPGCVERVEVERRIFSEARTNPGRYLVVRGHEASRDRPVGGDGYILVDVGEDI